MRDKVIVEKMIRYATKVCEYCKGISYDEFQSNDMLIEACVFNLSQIGELTTRLGDKFKKDNPQMAWAQICGLRNRIVHDYEGVNLNLIWEIISDDIPELQQELIAIKKRFSKDE